MDRLASGEMIIKPHWRAFGVWYLAILLFALGPMDNPKWLLSQWQSLIVAAVIAIGIVYQASASRLKISPAGVERTGGLIDRQTKRIAAADLAEIKTQAGLIHRVLGVGVLIFVPRGQGDLIKFWGVADPKGTRRAAAEELGLIDEA